MSSQGADADFSEQMHSLIEESRSNSEAFSILGAEIIEIKAMLMALIDLQKSTLFASGVSESELEANVQNLIDGYRKRFLSAMQGRIKEASEQQ